jgi:hypothetical protein
MNDAVALLQSRQEIMDCMYWYCRGFDRLDQNLFSKVFHPTATIHYPFIEGPWPEVVEWLIGTFEAYDVHSLQLSQVMIAFADDGRSASSESYVTASFWRAEGDPIEQVLPGHTESVSESTGNKVMKGTHSFASARYVDQWSYTDGRWAIDDRRAVVDFYTSTDATGWIGDGRRNRDDPSYTLAFMND